MVLLYILLPLLVLYGGYRVTAEILVDRVDARAARDPETGVMEGMEARTLGPASEVIAAINDRSLLYLEAPVKRVTGYDVVTPYFGRENMYLPTADQVAGAIGETLDF